MIKKLKYGLLLEGVLAFNLAIFLFCTVKLESPIYILFLPFDLIGKGLRQLSLSSFTGNAVALFLYAILSLLPVIYLVVRRLKAGVIKADLLLPVISLFSFYMLYEFVNPNFMLDRMPDLAADGSMLPVIKLSFAILFFTLLIGYLILRMTGTLSVNVSRDKAAVLCWSLQKLLIIIAVINTFLLGYFTTFQLIVKLDQYISQKSAGINILIVIVTYLLEGLPILYSVLILIKGIELLEAMTTSHMKEAEIKAAARTGEISKQAVYVTFLCNITANILQFLLSRQLSDVNFSLQLSLLPLAIAFAAMILSGFFKETKELQEDNEMII